MKRRISVWLLSMLTLVLIVATAPVSAQGTALPDGVGVISALDANVPFQFYTVSLAAGDLVSLRVDSLNPGAMLPTLSINSPAGQQLAFSSGDPTSPAPGSARIDLRAEQPGTYTVQVGSSNSGAGQFVIHTDILQGPEMIPLSGPAVIQFTPQQTVVAVSIPQDTANALDFTVVGAETRLYVALHGADGSLRSVNTVQGTLTTPIAAGSMMYTAIITNMDASTVTAEVSTSSATGVTAPPTPVNAAACTITTGSGGTNLRSGPGTNYGVITTLPAATSYPVTGQNSGWYTIDYLGQVGWLASSVTTLSGPCNGLPFVEAPAVAQPTSPPPTATSASGTAPTVAPTTDPGTGPTMAPPTAQPTDETGTSPTVAPTTVLPTTAPPTTAPPTATEAAQQVAPPDSAYFVEVDIKGGQATLGDAVSYPDGDTEDEIFWDVVGFDSITTAGNLQVVITCTGDGTGNVTFFSSGSNYACGDTFTQFVTNDSDSGLIRVTATSGDNTYVQYTLLFLGTPAN